MAGIDDREYHKVAPVPATGRPSIYELREPAVDLGAWLDADLPMLRGARVLDAGCGPGLYVEAVRARAATLVALDIAHGRLTGFTGASRVAGDVQALPFPDASFDAAMAMHMLYHVPDIPSAVGELRRVVRAGGVFYALTNSRVAQWELTEVFLANGGTDDRAFGDDRFCNENGEALLRTAFDDVTLVEDTSTSLVVSDAECVVDELQRLRYTLANNVAPGAQWDELISGVRRDVQAVIDRDGAFRMGENHGLFICR